MNINILAHEINNLEGEQVIDILESLNYSKLISLLSMISTILLIRSAPDNIKNTQ